MPKLSTKSVGSLTAGQIRRLGTPDQVDCRDFGTIPDGVFNGSTGVVGGTNNSPMIQAAIDYAVANNIRNVYLPSGAYRIDDTIYIGKGTGPVQIHFYSQAQVIIGTSGGQGCALIANFVDRPMLNIQTGYNCCVEFIQFMARRFTPLQQNSVALDQYAVESNYFYSSGVQYTNTAPFCGVAIDGWSGSQPSPSYPTTTVAYGRNQSSGCQVRNCRFFALPVGIALQPNNDSNGDFMDFSGNEFLGGAVGILIGNSQARNTNISNCNFNTIHTCISGIKGYAGRGQCGGNWENIHAIGCYRLFAIDGGWSNPIHVSNFYAEATAWSRIGDITGASAGTMSFTGCKFDCSDGAEEEHQAKPVLTGGNACTFINCSFYAYRLLLDFYDSRPIFINCRFRPIWQLTTRDVSSMRSDTYERQAAVYLSNVLLQEQRIWNVNLNQPMFRNCNVPKQGSYGVAEYDSIDSDDIMSWWSIGAAQGRINYDITPFQRGGMTVLIDNGTKSQSGRTVTFQSNYDWIALGDLFCIDQTYWVYVATKTGTGPFTFTAKALNRWSRTGALVESHEADLTTPAREWHYFPVGVFDVNIPTWVNGMPGLWKIVQGVSTVSYLNDVPGVRTTLPAAIGANSKPFWGWYLSPYSHGTNNSKVIGTIGSTSIILNVVPVTSGYYWAVPGIARYRAKELEYGSAAPTTGYHDVGDIVWNTGATSGGLAGFICTGAGTPGTWKTFATIS